MLRETAHTQTHHIHAQMNPYRYLEQWFGFPFPSPFSPLSLYLRNRDKNVSLVGLCLIKSRVYDDTFEAEKTHSVHLTLAASSLQQQTRRLIAYRPLGRVEGRQTYASPGSVSFPCGFLKFYLVLFFFICGVLL